MYIKNLKTPFKNSFWAWRNSFKTEMDIEKIYLKIFYKGFLHAQIEFLNTFFRFLIYIEIYAVLGYFYHFLILIKLCFFFKVIEMDIEKFPGIFLSKLKSDKNIQVLHKSLCILNAWKPRLKT